MSVSTPEPSLSETLDTLPLPVTPMSLLSLFLLPGKPFLLVSLLCLPLALGWSFGHPLLWEASRMLEDGIGDPKAEWMHSG